MSTAKVEATKEAANNSSYIYQNPLLNPTNGTKNIPPSPVLSTEMFWPELENAYDLLPVKKSPRSSGYLRIPKKPDGWTELVDHSEFIETMFHNVRKDVAQDQMARLAQVNNTAGGVNNSVLKVKTLDIGKNPDTSSLSQSTNASERFNNPRKLEAPWRNVSSFTTPSALRKETFQNFSKMSPEPPTTPPKGKQVRIPVEPPPRKQKREEHHVVGRHMRLIPTPIDSTASIPAIPKHTSFPLPSNRRVIPGLSELEKGLRNLHKISPLQVQPIVGNNSQPPPLKLRSVPTATDFQPPVKIQPILNSIAQPPPPPPKTPAISTSNNYKPPAPVRPSFGVKPRAVLHPVPLSKRRESFPQNQPTLYHTMYYGVGGRRTTGQMPPQMNVKKVFGINSRKDVRIGGDKTMATNSQQKPSGSNSNPPRKQSARRVRPAMMFPFHVPGPKHDNIYISDYHGSDTESEPETHTVQGTNKENIGGNQ